LRLSPRKDAVVIHKNRPFKIAPVESFALLAEKLTEHDWTTCSGFSCGTLTLLNDAFSADGAQEYAVIKDGRQIESLTCSWMKAPQLQAMLEKLDAEGSTVDLGPLEIVPHCAGYCSRCA
jgi:hypothetical protein